MYYKFPFLVAIFFLSLFSITNIVAASSMMLTKTKFETLSHWQQDDHIQALFAFQKSCVEINKRHPHLSFSAISQSGLVSDWQSICAAANKIRLKDKLTARQFFETWFEPYSVKSEEQTEGLFTGYYLPLLHGSLTPTKRFHVPIYALPDDLIKVDLGLFRPEWAGKFIVGQIKNNTLYPYPERSAIDNRQFNKKARVLVWVDNPIDVYFAQVQGSAVIELPNKKQFVIGYAGGNGRPYTSIGKILIESNQLTKQTVSMQTIRAWLEKNPKQMKQLFNRNASYVFFKILKDKEPLGTEKVPLTKERSIAIDNRYLPFGAPIWLSTTIPANNPTYSSEPFHQLLIAQDTGGAIKGVVRGDIYWGTGEKAKFIAGHMNSPGNYWVLLPR